MTERNLQIMNIPISNDGVTMRNVVVYAPIPLTADEWDTFHTVLKNMAPAIVKPGSVLGEGVSDERE